MTQPHKPMKRILSVTALVFALSGCPPVGVVCKPGTSPCGTGCVDVSADRRNCGQCGRTCEAQQDCNQGECQCRAGTEVCGNSCSNINYDAQNCGQCGKVCDSGLVCEQRQCQAHCSAGFVQCLASCVDVTTDLSNCGACGVVCAQGQQCIAGACDFPAVAACYWSGQVVGFNPGTGVKGVLSDVGTNPGALARFGTTVLSADGTDRRLYGAEPASTGGYVQSALASQVGAVPNQVWVNRPYAYVANAGTGTLQVLQEAVDAGVIRLSDSGNELVLGTVGELSFGLNSFPEGMAQVGSSLWVPLYGGYGADGATAGQAVAIVDISNPQTPTETGRISLSSLNLLPFDGGSPVPRPWTIIAWNNAVYVALNNLNPDSFVPEGPGMLAHINPQTREVSTIDLGAADCLNPQGLTAVGDWLAVSCGGRVTYGQNGNAASIEASGVVAINATHQRLTQFWNTSSATACPQDAECVPFMPGRLTAVDSTHVMVADQNGGRVIRLLVDESGVRVADQAAALQLCPVNETTKVANVADILAR